MLPALVQMSRLKAPVRLERNLRYIFILTQGCISPGHWLQRFQHGD